jgi:hypothetical protein
MIWRHFWEKNPKPLLNGCGEPEPILVIEHTEDKPKNSQPKELVMIIK